MASDIRLTVIDESGRSVSFLKILPYKNGGFGGVLPSLEHAGNGRLEKTFVNYDNEGTRLKITRDEKQQYSASDIVKFSYHPDGFVQFSSTNNSRIVSGRDKDGTPKGLGLLSWPLSNPISTGPSMTISFTGLHGFTEAKPSKIDNRYAFETPRATPHPKTIFEKEDARAYAMAFYILPISLEGDIVEVSGRKYAHMAMMQVLSNGGSFMRLRELIRVIEIPNEPYMLGISWFCMPAKLRINSGYIFSGPTDGKRGLVASYLAGHYDSELEMQSLEFKAEFPGNGKGSNLDASVDQKALGV